MLLQSFLQTVLLNGSCMRGSDVYRHQLTSDGEAAVAEVAL